MEPVAHARSWHDRITPYLTLQECAVYAATSKEGAAAVQRTIAARARAWGVAQDGESEEQQRVKMRSLWEELPFSALFVSPWAQPLGKEATLCALRALPLDALLQMVTAYDYSRSLAKLVHVQKSVLAGAHAGAVKPGDLSLAWSVALHWRNCDLALFLLKYGPPEPDYLQISFCPLCKSLPLTQLFFDRGLLAPTFQGDGDSVLLCTAIAWGQLEVVTFLLAQGANPNAGNKLDRAPLRVALDGDSPAILAALLQAGADPNICDDGNDFPLFCTHRYPLAALLLRHGAEIEHRDEWGRTALYYCVAHPPLIALLLRWGANPHCVDRLGMTPLHWAVLHGQKETIQLLFDAGNSLDQKRGDGKSAFELTQRADVQQLLSRLRQRQRARPEAPRRAKRQKQMGSHAPCRAFQIDDLIQLIFSYLRVAEWTSFSRLSKAARCAAAALMAQRAREWKVATPHMSQEQQRAALRAVWSELALIYDFAPAAVQRTTRRDRETLLYRLHALPFASCARLFLREDYLFEASQQTRHVEASLFATPHPKESEAQKLTDLEVKSLLTKAAHAHHPELVRFLIAYGALEGRKLEVCSIAQEEALFTLFLDHHLLALDATVEGESLLHCAIRHDHQGVASLLLQRGVDPNQRDFETQEIPLTRCLRHQDSSPLLPMLLEAGANPNLADKRGRTALFLVSDPIEVGLLLDYGAEVNWSDRNGETPLHFHAKDLGGYGRIALLLQRGANPNATNHEGKRPIDGAKEPESIKLLLAAAGRPI